MEAQSQSSEGSTTPLPQMEGAQAGRQTPASQRYVEHSVAESKTECSQTAAEGITGIARSCEVARDGPLYCGVDALAGCGRTGARREIAVVRGQSAGDGRDVDAAGRAVRNGRGVWSVTHTERERQRRARTCPDHHKCLRRTGSSLRREWKQGGAPRRTARSGRRTAGTSASCGNIESAIPE